MEDRLEPPVLRQSPKGGCDLPTRPAAQGGDLVLVHSQQAAWNPAESGTEGGMALDQDKDELTDSFRPTAAEDDFRGQAFATEASSMRPSAHTRAKIACRGGEWPGATTLVAKRSRLLQACRS